MCDDDDRAGVCFIVRTRMINASSLQPYITSCNMKQSKLIIMNTLRDLQRLKIWTENAKRLSMTITRNS